MDAQSVIFASFASTFCMDLRAVVKFSSNVNDCELPKSDSLDICGVQFVVVTLLYGSGT